MKKKPIMFQDYLFHFSEENGFLLAKTRENQVENLDQGEKDFIKGLKELNPIYIKSDFNNYYDGGVDYAQVNIESKYFLQGFLLTLTGIGNKKLHWDKKDPDWFLNYKKELKETDSGLISIKLLGMPENYQRLEQILKYK